jgi:RNA polymerase sigma-70 factor (ECF subfamily)
LRGFFGGANLDEHFVRLMDDGMTKLATKPSVRAESLDEALLPDEAFVQAFNEVRTELVSTLFFLLGNHADAQDAAQDAFLKCWRTRDSLGEVRNMRAWIFRVGLNAAKDLQRSAWRRRAKPLHENVGQDAMLEINPAESLEEQEALEQLRQALVELRPEEKAVFLLRQNGELTYEEIAELRRCPVGTVKTQMRAAMHKLRRVLQPK